MAYISDVLEDFEGSFLYYWEQLYAGFWMKAFIATLATFFTDVLFGDVVVISIYFTLSAVDLCLGVTRAKLTDTYQSRFLLFWIRKMVSYGIITLVLGLFAHQLFRLTSVTIQVVNWSLFFCSITEVTSIVNNLRKMGMPVPGHVDKWIAAWRRKAETVCSSNFDATSNDFSFKEIPEDKDAEN